MSVCFCARFCVYQVANKINLIQIKARCNANDYEEEESHINSSKLEQDVYFIVINDQ